MLNSQPRFRFFSQIFRVCLIVAVPLSLNGCREPLDKGAPETESLQESPPQNQDELGTSEAPALVGETDLRGSWETVCIASADGLSAERLLFTFEGASEKVDPKSGEMPSLTITRQTYSDPLCEADRVSKSVWTYSYPLPSPSVAEAHLPLTPKGLSLTFFGDAAEEAQEATSCAIWDWEDSAEKAVPLAQAQSNCADLPIPQIVVSFPDGHEGDLKIVAPASAETQGVTYLARAL